MSAVVTELNIGRRLGAFDSERRYRILGATSEDDANTALVTYLTGLGAINGMSLDLTSPKVEEFGEDMFYGEATWRFANLAAQPPNSFHISFDISGQTIHLTQSRATIATYPLTGTAYDFKGAVNVDEDGTIDGVDIIAPVAQLKINYTFADSSITDSFIATLVNTVGCVNSDSFHEFAAGVLLFSSVTGQKRDDTNWDLSYGFGVSKNATGLSVGDITGIDKKGWEYMWAYYKTVDIDYGGGLKRTHKIPVQVNVEQLYDTATFGDLGI
jgi:hypothetical protein